MAGFDAVFVGSGVNSLAAGALLAKEGWRVCVLERNDWLGGAIKTVDGLTAPGFTTRSSPPGIRCGSARRPMPS